MARLSDISWIPESSASTAGPWSASGLTSTVTADDGLIQTVQVTIPADATRKMFRLRVAPQ